MRLNQNFRYFAIMKHKLQTQAQKAIAKAWFEYKFHKMIGEYKTQKMVNRIGNKLVSIY